MSVKLAKIIKNSESNGPGIHYTIWFQGCNLNCPECFNPHTHNRKGGFRKRINQIVKEIKHEKEVNKIKGVTLTGGEPLQQLEGVFKLVKEIKTKVSDIGIIILTGYEPEELEKMEMFKRISTYVDVFIAGRYRKERKIQKGIRGSDNKKYLFLTEYYARRDFDKVPQLEVIVGKTGSIVLSGIEPEIMND